MLGYTPATRRFQASRSACLVICDNRSETSLKGHALQLRELDGVPPSLHYNHASCAYTRSGDVVRFRSRDGRHRPVHERFQFPISLGTRILVFEFPGSA